MSTGNWYSGGFNAVKEEQAASSKRFEFGNNEMSRFRVKVGTESKVIFLDDFSWQVSLDGNQISFIPFGRWEHKAELNEDWKNTIYATCTKGVSPCKFCEAGFKRYYVGSMTVLDCTEYVDKSGKKVTMPRKRIMPAAPKAMSIIEAKKNKKGNLLGWQYSVTRHENKDPRVGSDFEAELHVEDVREFLKKHGEAGVGINLDPYGFTAEKAFEYYRNFFTPMPFDQQEKLFKSCNVVDGSVLKEHRKPGVASAAAVQSVQKEEAAGDVIPY